MLRFAFFTAISIAASLVTGSFAEAQTAAPTPAPLRSRSAAFTPDISVNSLFLYQNSNRGNLPTDVPQNGISLQEAELQFMADVDPYFRFVSTFALRAELNNEDPAATPYQYEFEFEPEELYVDTQQVPFVGFRIGKFKAAFGRHNLLHTHAFPFIDAPLINSQLLGEEGINDVGVSAAALIPGLPWFSEITLQALSGRLEGTDYWNSQSPNDNAYVGHFKNLWDLSDDLTFEFGLSAARGKNEFANAAAELQRGDSDFLGADVTFKWRPLIGGNTRALIWSTEYIDRKVNRPESRNDAKGFASWVQYQLAQRWWIQARTEYLQAEDNDAAPLALEPFQRKHSALVSYFPSEFSGFRLQYSHLSDSREEAEQKLMLQFSAMIGAHPAHAY